MKDIHIHYFVNKTKTEPVDIALIIRTIQVYVQNDPIFFSYSPTFSNGTLIFGIVGFKSDHDKFKEVVGSDLKILGCELNISMESEWKVNTKENG